MQLFINMVVKFWSSPKKKLKIKIKKKAKKKKAKKIIIL